MMQGLANRGVQERVKGDLCLAFLGQMLLVECYGYLHVRGILYGGSFITVYLQRKFGVVGGQLSSLLCFYVLGGC